MKTDKPNNSPAFPVSPEESKSKISSVHGGMTLRDYFAAKAMQSLVSIAGPIEGAETAYKWADAMLKERES